MMQRFGVLWIGKIGDILGELKSFSDVEPHAAKSLDEGKKYLKQSQIKVVLSEDISVLEWIKKTYPNLVRIAFLEQLDIASTQSAINRGEAFRFIPAKHDVEELHSALKQGASHYDLMTKHQVLLKRLKLQNKKLESIIETLEHQVKQKTKKLEHTQSELQHTKDYLEQLNTLIAWLNESSNIDELKQRLEEALKKILPIQDVILSFNATEQDIQKIKDKKSHKVVVPLVSGPKTLGHLYFMCASESQVHQLQARLGLIKQVSDTVALTLEKIQIFEDSVEKKQAWQKTFDSIRDPVALVDQNYRIVRANMTYSQKSGVDIQKLIGQKCYEVFQKRSSPCEGCKLEFSLEHQSRNRFELKSQAQQTFYAVEAFPTKPITQGLGVMYYRDQGEERRLKHQLIEAEKMAEIGILAGSVAHEINNPLGGILAYAQVLLSEVPPASTLYQDLKEVERSALKAKSIVENLLFFSRASKKEEKQSLQLEAVIEKALSLISLKLRHEHIQIQKKVQAIPPVHADFNQLVQVVLNLLNNALYAILEKKKETPKEEGEITIFVTFDAKTHIACIEISDNGKGILSSDLSRIFNPFFTTKDKTAHPGMGLAVSYQMIQHHGGEIQAESEVDRGSTFKVFLPVILTGLKGA